LPLNARILLAGYVVANLAYSTWLKRVLLIDVVALAAFYSMRVLLGGLVTGIPISTWTIAFSSFFFLSLALAKRLGELKYLEAGRQSLGRGYLEADRKMVVSLASATSATAILVLALYVKNPAVELLYRRPNLLLLICPVLGYWLWRLLILANRGQMNDDPVVFVFNDWVSYFVGVVVAMLIWIAI
jgi:4-hydroxybenzoate polyprenyltransferase